ncbi:hypothetical protein [Virgibacillus kimchii]
MEFTTLKKQQRIYQSAAIEIGEEITEQCQTEQCLALFASQLSRHNSTKTGE